MIRLATKEDLPSIYEIYGAARRFMAENNNPTQWGDVYPPDELLALDVERRRLYAVADDGRICGSFVFIIGEDPVYQRIEDGAWLSDAEYGAIHRIASDGTRRGVFQEAIDYCKGVIGHIRIDTHTDNLVMQHLVEKNGFIRCGTVFVRDDSPRIAYEYIEA